MSRFTDKIRVFHKSFWDSETPRKTIASLIAVALVAVVGMLSLGIFSAQSAVASNSKMVVIYDGNSQKVIVTKSDKIRDALKDAKISLSRNDVSKPGSDEEITKNYTVVNVYRARDITVTDGAKTQSIYTAAQTNGEIAAAAGMPILAADEAELRQVSPDKMIENGVGLELAITRAKVVNAKIYGQNLTLRTQKNTVGELLKEIGVNPTASDTMSVSRNAKIVSGMNLTVWRNGIQTIQSEEEIPFETEKVNDDTKALGFSQITTPGKNGKKNVIYQVNMRDGQEISRTKISEVVTIQSVKQVEVVGTKVVLPPGSHTDWMAMAGILASDYGYVEFIISHESGWRYNAANPSGAYGLPQALPGSKMASAGADWATNPITQLKWVNGYVSRYGGWAGAYAHWQNYHSY